MFNQEVKMYIQIEVPTDEEKMKIGEKIHEQLRGNQDYIDNNIILNVDEMGAVRLWVFNECENIPQITI